MPGCSNNYIKNKERLGKAIKKLETLADRMGLQINREKAKYMVMGSKPGGTLLLEIW